MSTSLILFISAAGVVQAFVLAGLLYFHPKGDRSVTFFLCLHILALSSFMLMPAMQYFFSWQNIILLVPFQFLIAPCLYLYVRSYKEVITWRRAWPHFVLFAIFLVLESLVYISWIKKYPDSATPPRESLLTPFTYILNVARNVQMILYYFFSLRVLNSYQRSIQHLYSETSKISLAWVRWLLNGFLLLIATIMIRFFLVVWYPEKYNLMVLINTALITPYIYVVTFKGLAQPTLWQIQPGKEKKNIEEEMTDAEMIKSSLKKEEDKSLAQVRNLPEAKAQDIIQRITLLMNETKLYQEPELTLQALADKLQSPYYLVSQAINEGLNKSFFELINGYRVEEAKRLLLDAKNVNYTILSIGFEAGFNSKTTFNTVFKKFTGLTPTDFRNQHKEVAATA